VGIRRRGRLLVAGRLGGSRAGGTGGRTTDAHRQRQTDNGFSPTGPWNTPLSANVPLAPNSAAIVASIMQDEQATNDAWGLNTETYSTPVFYVSRSTPVQTWTYSDCQNMPQLARVIAPSLKDVPTPRNLFASKGTDEIITIYQPSTDTYWEPVAIRPHRDPHRPATGPAAQLRRALRLPECPACTLTGGVEAGAGLTVPVLDFNASDPSIISYSKLLASSPQPASCTGTSRQLRRTFQLERPAQLRKRPWPAGGHPDAARQASARARRRCAASVRWYSGPKSSTASWDSVRSASSRASPSGRRRHPAAARAAGAAAGPAAPST